MTTKSSTSTKAAGSARTPSKGRIVFVPTDVHSNNGEDYAPAMIVRVFDSGLINVRVLTDSTNPPEWRTSVELHDERPDNPGHHAWWPPTV